MRALADEGSEIYTLCIVSMGRATPLTFLLDFTAKYAPLYPSRKLLTGP